MVILSWMAFKVAGITSGVNLSSMVDKYPRARPEWYTNLTSALGISRTSWRTRVSVIIPDVSDLEIKVKKNDEGKNTKTWVRVRLVYQDFQVKELKS